MKNVVVLLPIKDEHKKKFIDVCKDCSIIFTDSNEVNEKDIQNANIIIGNPDASMIKASENLELLQLSSAGADAYIKDGILSSNTILTNATGAYSPSVAENAFAVTLMLLKKFYLYRDNQNKSQWKDMGRVRSLSDCTVLIAGLGDIGQYYARLVKAMGAYVIGVKRRKSDCPECVDELYLTENIKDVLPKADVVMSVLPGTKDTYHLYTDEMFDLMKDDAIFINCGRGSAVESSALEKALKEGKIASAAIDVTEIEPLPEDSPLWSIENLFITPHVYGGYHLDVTLERIVDISLNNIDAHINGRQLKNVVDFSTGYKK